MKIELKPYEKETSINIWINGEKCKYKSKIEFVDIPLGELLRIYEHLKHPKWYVKMFSDKYIYYKHAIEDVEEALNRISLTAEYRYIKQSF